MIKELRHIQLHDMMSYLKAVVASLVLCFTIQGCDKEMGEPESTIDDNTIGFNAGVEKTRAVVGSISDVQNNGGFSVWGSYTNSDGTLQKVFNGENVYWQTASGSTPASWTYNETKYWNPGKTYNFFAVYPKAQNTVSLSDDGESYKLTFQLPAKADVDLLTATKSITATKKEDGNFPAVDFEFSHILSKININVKKSGANTTAETGAIVIVNSITISNIMKSGAYDSENGWNNLVSGMNYSSANNINVTLGEELVDETIIPTNTEVQKDLLFIPQTINDGSITLKIYYTIKSGNTQDSYIAEAPIPNNTIGRWDPQLTYTYNVQLKEVENKILFNTPIVNGWTNEKPVGGSIIIQ